MTQMFLAMFPTNYVPMRITKSIRIHRMIQPLENIFVTLVWHRETLFKPHLFCILSQEVLALALQWKCTIACSSKWAGVKAFMWVPLRHGNQANTCVGHFQDFSQNGLKYFFVRVCNNGEFVAHNIFEAPKNIIFSGVAGQHRCGCSNVSNVKQPWMNHRSGKVSRDAGDYLSFSMINQLST